MYSLKTSQSTSATDASKYKVVKKSEKSCFDKLSENNARVLPFIILIKTI